MLELPEYHPIVQMLWDKSRLAAKGMEEEQSSHRRVLVPDRTTPTTADDLDKKAKEEREQELLETMTDEKTSGSI